jgi:monofunctional biosynthetic peptidoglycan transglycosylase
VKEKTARHLARRRRERQRREKRATKRTPKRAAQRRPTAQRRTIVFLVEVLVFCFAATAVLVAPWRWIPPPTSAFMLRARVVDGVQVDQRWVPFERISPDLVLCAVASEDQKFPEHAGFDVDQIIRATQEARARPRGASTITQQVAKNLFLWPGRSFVRKGLEAYLTVWIEQLWPKRRILEVYLNVAEFGPGIYGAAAASERFFGKRADQLGLREAALLTAVLPNPKQLSAARPSEFVRGRTEEIQRTARALGPRHVAGL